MELQQKFRNWMQIDMVISGQTITFTIDSLSASTQGTFTIPTRVMDADKTGLWLENTATLVSAQGTTLNKPSDTTYHQTHTQAIVTKTWDDRDNQFNTRTNSIEVQLYADGQAISGQTAELSEENDWSYTFENLDAFNDEGSKIVYTAQEINVPDGYTESNDGLDVTNVATFEESGDSVLRVQKYKTDTTDAVEGAIFALKDENGDIVYTATTDENGLAVFNITPDFNESSISYTLSEESTPAGYIKSEDTWTVTFTKDQTPSVTLDGRNVFQVVWDWITSIGSEQTDTLVVYNDYQASGSWTLQATKELVGKELVDGEFNFTITENGNVIVQATNTSDGTITFDSIEYNQNDVGTHTYTISEVNDNQTGITYDTATHEIKVTVVDNGDGTLSATADLEDEIVFNNTYEEPKTPVDAGDKENPSKSNTTKTGLQSDQAKWMSLLIVGVIGLFVLLVSRRKKQI